MLLEQILEKRNNNLTEGLFKDASDFISRFISSLSGITSKIIRRIKGEASSTRTAKAIQIISPAEKMQIVKLARRPPVMTEGNEPLPAAQQIATEIGFLLEYAICYGVATRVKVPVLKRLPSGESGGEYMLMEALGGEIGADTYKIDEIMELVQQANIGKTIKGLGRIYYREKNKILVKLDQASEADQIAFKNLFGETRSLKQQESVGNIVDDMISALGKNKVVAVAHAGDYTSALFKADFSVVYVTQKGKHAIQHYSLKLYSEKAEMINILGARPYVFKYLIDNGLDDAGYTAKEARDAWGDDHGWKEYEREGKSVKAPNVTAEDAKETLDAFGEALMDEDIEIDWLLDLFTTILHGQEGSLFLGYKKSRNEGLIRIGANIEMIHPDNVEKITVREWGEGWAIQAEYTDEDDVYHRDNLITLSPEDKRINIKFKVYNTSK